MALLEKISAASTYIDNVNAEEQAKADAGKEQNNPPAKELTLEEKIRASHSCPEHAKDLDDMI